jgi:hypothetical protein
VEQGHSYFVWSLDTDTDLACLVFVREHEVGKRCLLDWYATDGTGRAQGSLKDGGAGERLVDMLVRLRGEVIARRDVLRVPEVVLQARKGAEGGNESRVYMNGELERIDEPASAVLDLTSEIGIDEPSRSYLEGGWIPDGQTFHVMRVHFEGLARGDGNGPGLFAVVVGGQELVNVETSPEPFSDAWTGDIELVPGDERRTYVGIKNSSAGEARLQGTFEPKAHTGFGRANAGFFGTVAPTPFASVPVPSTYRGKPLASPRVVLQARCGRGGNANRLDLTGKTNIHVDRVEPLPLDFSQPPTRKDDSLVYCEGGHVPDDMQFVVTRATWWGSSAGHGHGELKVVVAGEVLCDEEDGAGPHQGAWNGRLVVLPREESRTYLEIANTSSGDVLLTGTFEPIAR